MQKYNCIIVEDEPQKIGKLINDVFHNPDRYEEIRKQAKTLASSVYTWQNFENEMIRHIPAE